MPKLALKAATALAVVGLLASTSVLVKPAEARKRNVDGIVGGIIVGGAIAAMAAEAQRAAAEEQKKKAKAKKAVGNSTKKPGTQPAVDGPGRQAPTNATPVREVPSSSPVHEAKTPAGTAAPALEAKAPGAPPAQQARTPLTQDALFGSVANRPPEKLDPFGKVKARPAPQIEARPPILPSLPAWLAAASMDFVAATQAAGRVQGLPTQDQVVELARDSYKNSELIAFQRLSASGWDADLATSWIILEAGRAIRAGRVAPIAETDAAVAYRATFSDAAREVYLQTLAAREASALSLSRSRFEEVVSSGAVTQGVSWAKEASALWTEVERAVMGEIWPSLGPTREDDIRAFRARQILVECVTLNLKVAITASGGPGVSPSKGSPDAPFGASKHQVVAQCGPSANAAVAPNQPLMRAIPFLQRASLESPARDSALTVFGAGRH